MSRLCREVRGQLPDLVDGTVPRWRRWLVTAHLRRCEDCRGEQERQRLVSARLGELGAVADAEDETPPEGLLDSLLEQADHPGLRGRAAVPVRGAVSGARPLLSVALFLASAAAGSVVGYAIWRTARAVRAHVRGRAPR